MQHKHSTWALLCLVSLILAGYTYQEMGFNSLKAIGPSDTQIDLWDPVTGGIKVAEQGGGGGGGGGGDATAANQVTGNASLSSIDGKLTSQATAANQTTANGSLASILAKIAAFGTAGTPSADVLSIQGRTGMTPVKSDTNVPIGSTTLASGVTTNTTSSAIAIPRGVKSFWGEVVCSSGACVQTQAIYGDRDNDAANGLLLCTLSLTATTRDQDVCAGISAEYPFYYVITTATSGNSATGGVYAFN